MRRLPLVFLRFLFVLFLGSVSSFFVWAQQFYINLQSFPLYMKTGFVSSDTASPDLEDGSWVVKDTWTNVIIGRQDLPGLEKRSFLSPWGKPAGEWTFVLPFTVDATVPSLPGLYLAALGVNWEIYLNGTLVRREMHLDETGRIYQHHSERDVLFPLDSRFLHFGDNLLVFRIVGDPTDVTVGFQYSSPYYVADYEYIRRSHSEVVSMFLIGIYILVGIYHFLLFAIHREDRFNGPCGFFSFGMGLYYLFRTHWIYYLIPDTVIVVKLEFFVIYLMLPALMIYTEMLCKLRVSLVTKIYLCFCCLLAVSQLVFSHSYGSDSLVVWQLTGIPAMVWILIHNLIVPFARELRRTGKFRAALINSYPGNMLIAVSLLGFTVIVDIFDSLVLHYAMDFTRYSMVLFVLAVAFMTARLYAKTNRELAEKSILLEKSGNQAMAREALFKSCDLTEREKEIARLMVEGLDNNEIAARIFVSPATVAFHVTNIYRKFGIIDGKNRGRAAFLAKLMGR